ncbi:MAG TPA: hypothetical protein VHM30_01350 [Gemmatimonadaceae bacterium]|nr:hypothetical protein [Gemmatimonadaceae bacterium]
MRCRSLSLLVVLPVVVACSSGGDDASSSDTGQASGAVDTDAPATAEHVAARFALQGGPAAGAFERAAEGGMCNDLSPMGQNSGSAQLEPLNFDGDDDPTGRQIYIAGLAIEDLSAARGGGTDNFHLTGTVADTRNPKTRYEIQIQPKEGRGSGTATAQGDGPLFTARVQGKTADGVTVDATFTCSR